jgi:hypothetical protein
MSGKYNMKIYQGSTFTRNVSWKDSTGTLIPLNDFKARMQIRKRTADGDLMIDLDNDLKEGITINITTNVLTVKITPTQTALLVPDNYVYSLELEDLTGNVYTLIYGDIKIISEVTHA